MLPVMALHHGFTPHNVLDMAAAPGSKTTQLSQSLPKQRCLIANDLSASRLKMLNANMIRMGIANFALLNQDASRITTNHLFDGILLDAPCGGEGTIRKDTKAWDNWSEESMVSLAEVQTNLLNNAWQMLATGGRIVYSTCTLSQVENQDVINTFLAQHQSDAELVDLNNLFQGAAKANHQGMLHLWPEIYDTQGFFVTVITKKGETESQYPGVDEATTNLTAKDTALIRNYYRVHFGIELPLDMALFEKTNKRHREIWLVPTSQNYQAMQRLQRQGIRLCQLIESRQGLQIKTHHEFSRCYGHLAQTNCLEITDTDCIDFFQGKNLMNQEATDKSNEIILKYLGHGIGLVKALGHGKLKSQLPRELVHDNAWA